MIKNVNDLVQCINKPAAFSVCSVKACGAEYDVTIGAKIRKHAALT